MRAIIVGCGQVGAPLAYELYRQGHEVVVVDASEASFERLPDDFRGRTIEGDVLMRATLRRAELDGADALFALTGLDALNALAAYIAHSEFGVKLAAARSSNPRQEALQQAFGVPVIATPRWRADNLAELLAAAGVQLPAPAPAPPRRGGAQNGGASLKVLILGGEAVGAQLAALLVEQRIDVRLVENRGELLAQLHQELPTETIYEDNPLDLQALEHAGIAAANVVVACTSNDAENLALCFAAQTRYSAARTIGRINNTRHAWLFTEAMRVSVALNESSILARLIEEEMTLGDMLTLLKLRRGRYSLVELVAPPGAPATGMAIKDIPFTETIVIAAIFRKGETIVPRGITVIQPGDEVLAVTDAAGQERLAELFGEGHLV